MIIHRFENSKTAGQAAATLVAAQLLQNPASVLGFATGETPIPAYQHLICLYKDGVVDFSRATSFNLDEYCRLPVQHECSYRRFMQEQLFDHINIPQERTHLPNGNAEDLTEEAARYDASLQQAGGIDIQILGIGHNGHIGFNEPADCFVYGCNRVSLTRSTIEANRRFFATEQDVPRQAITMGIGSIMQARKIVLIATGANKAEAIRKALRDEITPALPASILRVHPNVTFLLDTAAASLL